MHCDICCSFPLHEMLKFHQAKQPLLTVMSTIVPAAEKEAYTYGRFIYDEGTKDILHYNDGEGQNVMFMSNGTMMPCQISNMVNCGVYLFTVQDL